MDECCTTNVRPSSLLPIGFQTEYTVNLVRNVHVSSSYGFELYYIVRTDYGHISLRAYILCL